MTKDYAKRGLRNRVILVSMVLNRKKIVLVCSRAVISRSEQNVGAHVDNRPPLVTHSQIDIHRYSVANIQQRLAPLKQFHLLLFFAAYHYYYAYNLQSVLIM